MNDVTSDSTDDHATGTAAFAPPAVGDRPMGRHDRLPIKMLQDRIMVQLDAADGERDLHAVAAQRLELGSTGLYL